MVWKILSALSAVCLGVACYFAWTNQKALVEERKREAYFTANLKEVKDHKDQAGEAKKNREAQLATANTDLETTKTAVIDTTAKAQTKEAELAVAKTNLDQVTKIVKDLEKQSTRTLPWTMERLRCGCRRTRIPRTSRHRG